MQNRNSLYTQTRKTFSYSNYNLTTSQTDIPGSAWDQFSYSGFGSNDKRRKVLPTAGTYSKDYWTSVIGEDHRVSYDPQGLRKNGTIYLGELSNLYSSNLHSLSSVDVPPAVINRALDKLYDEIRETELNIAVSLAEAPETYRMLRGCVEIVKWARKAKRKALQNPSKLLSEIWLGYKYGWLPAYNDIYNFWYHRNNAWFQRGFDFVGRATMPLELPSPAHAQGTKNTLTGKRRVTIQYGLNARLDDHVAFDIGRLTSFNPLQIIWELTPLSFAADWLFNFGGYMELVEASMGRGLKFNHGYRTTLYRAEVESLYELSSKVPQSGGDVIWNYVYAKARRNFTFKQRIVLTGFPRPEFPRVKVNMGSQRILSAAALVRTILLGKVK